MVTIQVNGEPREVPKGLNVTELVAHLGLTANRLAIERNLEIASAGPVGNDGGLRKRSIRNRAPGWRRLSSLRETATLARFSPLAVTMCAESLRR